MGTFPLNDGWMFAPDEPRGFAPVRLPHDWLIGDTQNLYRSGVGYYRRTLNAGFLRPGQQVYLRFDGVYMDSTVWVNGEAAGEWKYGCTAFTLNISGFLLKDRENELLVRVNYQAPSARWYTGAGIYRDVSLIVKNECHFVPDGIYVSTFREGEAWRYTATAETETGGRPCEVRHTLLGADESPAEVRPWSVEEPSLYTLLSELVVDGVTTDTVRTRIGFRETAFTTDRGLLFNGEPVKLKGVCLHDDLGALGSAFHRQALRRRLQTMKAMGANALRTAHNPPASALMEMADEMGFLVLSELLDVWKRPKNEYDYARFFDAWAERDAAAWVRRDRNHPSLILWSLGNEIADLNLDAEEGPALLRRLKSAVEKHDPRHNAAVTFCSNYMHGENSQRCADIVKRSGTTTAKSSTKATTQRTLDWVLFSARKPAQPYEPWRVPFPARNRCFRTTICNAGAGEQHTVGAKSVEDCVLLTRKPYRSAVPMGRAGLPGEPTPYLTKSAYLVPRGTRPDFPRIRIYVIGGWADPRTAPMVHLFPFWDFPRGR
jgi:beta-galactosidase